MSVHPTEEYLAAETPSTSSGQAFNEFEEEVYVFPLSFAQQRLWFLDQFEPGSPFYNIPLAVRIRGKLNVAALEATLNEIVRRHETLRTTFAVMDGDPVQLIAPRLELPLPVVSLEHLPADAREAEALRLAQEEAQRPFDLQRGPLFRARLLQLDRDDYVGLFTMHHIVSDGWSMGVLMGEIGAIYAAFSRGLPSPLPELPIQYADFAEWQREWLEGEALEGQLAYWRARLGDDHPVLKLPTDRPRPAVQTSVGDTHTIVIPRALTDALKDLGRRENATLFMLLLAAFQTLLHRYSGQEVISVGSPIANRNRAEIEGLIGIFINTLVFQNELGDNPTFRALLRRVRQTTLEAYDHQDLPFETLVDRLNVARDMSHSPLFQVMLILQNAPGGEQSGAGELEMEQLEIHSGTSTFDITLSVTEDANGLDASFEFNTDLFDKATIVRMGQHLETLLAGVVADPDRPLSRYNLLTADERRLVVETWNATAVPFNLDQCAHHLIEAQAAAHPEATAVVMPAFMGAERQALTYGELNGRANQLAHHLRSLGVGPNVLVAVCVERGLDMIVGALGVLKAGGAYVPLDPTYPDERLADMLEDSAAPVIVTNTADRLASLDISQAAIVDLTANWPQIANASIADSPLAPRPSQPDDLVYMIYTSGSTGRSKGVMLEHRNLVNAYYAWEEAYRLDEARSHLQMANFAFDVFSGDFIRALGSGGKLVICPREWLLAPEQLYALMRAEQIDIAEFVPAVLRQLIQYLDDTEQRLDFMRLLACGSDSWYVKEYRNFLRFLGSQTRLINSFGLTEATIDSSYFESSKLDRATDQLAPIGRPFANMQLYILDQHLQPAPIGIPSELYVGGAGVARGYHNRPDLTAEKFIPDPFGDLRLANRQSSIQNRKLYRTGDLARWLPDGNVEFLGRIDNQVKIRGFRIELGEIESALGSHPDVSDAVVLALKAPTGDNRLVAYVVPDAEVGDLSASDLRRFLQERVPDYMVPAAFVLIDAMPLLPNGKINRRALPEPDWSKRDLADAYVAPRTPVEALLADIWQRVLHLERVGVHDDFFALGGHSLLATQLVSRVRDAFEIELPLRNIFESPTVATLAETVEVLGRTAVPQAPPITPIPRPDPSTSAGQGLPLSFAQQRLWFLDQLEPNSPFYNIPEAVRLVGPLNPDLFERALNEIVRRHEALRTTFATTKDGRPVQVIHPALRLPLKRIDLTHLPKAEREAESEKLAMQEAQRPFDLAAGPLLRAALVKLGAQDHVILLTIHHIIGDDWSTSVLVQELAVLYAAFEAQRPSPLPDLPIQYADFAHWQRNWLQGEVLQSHLDYWKQKLRGAPALLDLPTDRPRPPVQSYNGDYLSFALPPELSQAVKKLCQREGVTPFMALLAAFQTLLFRYSGQDDISVGTPIANRNRGDIEGLIGFFVNTLVLRTDLSANDRANGGALSFRELLQRVRETALDAYAHQDLPFEMIVDAVQPERNLSHSPLFQVMFALQNTPQQAPSGGASELVLQPVEAHSGTSKFDLTLFMVEDGDHFSGALEFNTDLFDHSTAGRLLRHFQTLLSAVVADVAQPITALPLMDAAERRQILYDWNATQAPVPDQLVHQQFEAQVARTPQAPAVRFADQQLTYAELNARANQLAHHLHSLGVGPDVLVALCVERSLEMAVGILGVLKAGGAYLPIDPTYPAERIAFMLADANPAVILTIDDLRLTIDDLQTRPELVEGLTIGSDSSIVNLDADWPTIAQQPATNPKSAFRIPQSTNLAYVIYTSGSTGRPKGAMITHGGLTNYLAWCAQAYPVARGQGTPLHSSISFDLTVTSFFPALLHGRTVHILPEDIGVEVLLSALREGDDYSLVKITPAHLELLSQQLDPAEVAGKTHAFVIGGENLLAENLVFWQEHAPDTLLINEYGPTETVVGCCVYTATADERRSGSMPIGTPIINTQHYILDTHLQPVPVGVAGELYIGGAGVARGYLNRPDLTAEKFIPNPFNDLRLGIDDLRLGIDDLRLGIDDLRFDAQLPDPQSAIHNPQSTILYRTGDLARYLADGAIEFLGRTDHQVKIHGFRIELGEIDAVLAGHPAVDEVITLAREDQPGDKRLVAYLVPVDKAPAPAELRAHLQETLPSYMIPSAFVVLEALPLTPNGKVDRAALPAPEYTHLDTAARTIAPRSPDEEILAGVFSQILHVARVGVHDSFFELGGHSLLATQVTSRLRDAFGVELPLRDLFEAPTVAGLAKRVEVARHSARGLVAPPIEPAPRTDPSTGSGQALPLSFAQQRLWFLDQLEPDSPLYNIPAPVRLLGALDVAALEASLNGVIARHEALRTTFETEDGAAVQVIHDALPITVPVTDLRHLPAEERETAAQRQMQLSAQRPFNLSTGPLLRAELWRLDDEEHIALLNMHHIVSDDWSLGVLIGELGALYVAHVNELPSPLPALTLQYADFAAWQRNWLQGEALETQLAYWRAQLQGAPPLLELPTDRPRPAVQTFRGAQVTFELPAELSTAVKTLSQVEGATLFMTLLAAYQAMLYRYTGQTDLSVGTPIANRNRSEIEPLIGFFVNTLVMRTRLDSSLPFRALLQAVRDAALGAYAHQDIPFEMLVDAIQPQRDMSHSPLFQVMFVLQNAPRQMQALSSDLRLEPVTADDKIARFDLTLTMVEDGDHLSGALEYNVDLFDAATIERMAGHFQTLLANLAAEPERPLAAVSMLTAAEQAQLLGAWNESAVDFPDRCVHELFEDQVAATPDKTALVFAVDGADAQRLTYAELNARANQLAHHLQSLGVGPETLVGISAAKSPAMVIGLLGILKAGGAYLPIDPTYPAERIAFMLEDANPTVILTQSTIDNSQFTTHNSQFIVNLDADWPTIAQQPDANPSASSGQAPPLATRHPQPDNLAYVIYTSGSTGRPKGVLLQHRGLVNLVQAQTRGFDVDASCRVLQFASFSFDASVSETFMALLNGATLYLAPQETLAAATELHRLLREAAITTVTLPPTMLRLLDPGGLDNLRTVISAGEACDPEIVVRWANNRLFVNAYGPTEATVGPTLCRVSELPAAVWERAAPIGRPIDNTLIYLLDADLQPVPVGAPGEICIGGVGLARGYHNRPDLTAEKFIPNPFSDLRLGIDDLRLANRQSSIVNRQSSIQNRKLYRTGDLARYLPDGNIEYLGRIDQQVKVRGFRIELGEIEARLAHHPGVQEVAVLARAAADSGAADSGHARLVAYVVPQPGTNANVSELRSFLQETLPEYMVPAIFVEMDAMPLTPNGKIDRRALPEPGTARPEMAAVYVAPRTPQEAALADIWTQVLQIARVGVHDNFFELGGDSILSIQVVARAQQVGLQLTPRDIFQHPTVAGLVAVAAGQAAQESLSGPVPLTPYQRWFLDGDPAALGHWTHALLLEVALPLDEALLTQSVAHLWRHHDALRLRFERDAAGWGQIYGAAGDEAPFTWVDLSATPPEAQPGAIEATAVSLQTNLDLAAGPLFQVAYFHLGHGAPGRLLIVAHRLVADEDALQIVLEDFQIVYAQLSQGQPALLPPKTTSFGAWAAQLQAQAESDELGAQLDYWLAQQSAPVLPVELTGGPHGVAAAHTVQVELSTAETEALLQEANAAYSTNTEELLLTALAQALAEHTDQTEATVARHLRGRELFADGQSESARTVGCFTLLAPTRLDLDALAAPGEAIMAVKEQIRQAPGAGGGYGLLRYLSPDGAIRAQLAERPQPEIGFSYQPTAVFGADDMPFKMAAESIGATRHLEATRPFLLEIDARGGRDGRLQLTFTYSANHHRRETIAALAVAYLDKLRALIAHCQDPEAGGVTASDFADFGWDADDLSDIMAQLGNLE